MYSKKDNIDSFEYLQNSLYVNFHTVTDKDLKFFRFIFHIKNIKSGDLVCGLNLTSPGLSAGNIRNVKDYINGIYFDLGELQKEMNQNGQYNGVKYIVGISHLSTKLKRFGFAVYDIDEYFLSNIPSFKKYFQYVGYKKLIYLLKSKIYTLLSELSFNESLEEEFYESAYINKCKINELDSVNNNYKLSNIKAAIIPKEEFLSIDFSK